MILIFICYVVERICVLGVSMSFAGLLKHLYITEISQFLCETEVSYLGKVIIDMQIETILRTIVTQKYNHVCKGNEWHVFLFINGKRLVLYLK